MSKKWYNYFVSVDEDQAKTTEPKQGVSPPRPARTAAQTVAEIATSVAEPHFRGKLAGPVSFDEIYAAAEINAPTHGYTILKVADMLSSEHIRSLPPEVRRRSVLVALDAASVKIEDVIQDAVRRDKALDVYERVQNKALDDLQLRKNEENQKIQAELDRYMAEQRARIQSNNDEVAKERERFANWRIEKLREEQKIFDAVAHFVSENPISTVGPPPVAPPKTGAEG